MWSSMDIPVKNDGGFIMLKKVSLLIVLGLALGISLNVLGADDCVCIWVEPGSSIQVQIDAAPPGSTVCLPEGTWTESIVIDKPLTLRGQGSELTTLQAGLDITAPVLWVKGSRTSAFSVMVEGLTLLGRTPGWYFERSVNEGMMVNGMVQVVLHDCTIQEALHGILLMGNSQTLVSSTRILGRQVLGRRLRGTGITLLGRAQASVVESTIAWVADGIAAENMAQVTVHNSVIKHTAFGVDIRDYAQALITHTHITDSEDGIVVSDRAHAQIHHCTIVRNKIGVVLLNHSAAVLTNNLIAESSVYGVLLALHDLRLWFDGFIYGADNMIPGPDEPDGNLYGAVYPDDISFLMTKDGGVYPQR